MKRFKTIIAQELPFLYSMPALLWQVLFLFVPLVIILYSSIAYDGLSWWPQFTIKHYAILLDSVYIRIIARSLLLATGTVLVCFFFAYPVAYFLALRVKRFKNILLFLLTLPFWTNFLIQIYAWFFLLERNGVINTLLLKLGIISQPFIIANNLWAVFIVMVYCYLPFMIMPLYTILTKIDIEFLESSADLGATPWQTFCRITLPLSVPGIQTGVLLVLVPAFGEFVIPALLGGAKYMMVGSLISYFFLVARNSAMGAAFTVASGLILLVVAIVFYRFCIAYTRYEGD